MAGAFFCPFLAEYGGNHVSCFFRLLRLSAWIHKNFRISLVAFRHYHEKVPKTLGILLNFLRNG